MQAVNIKQEVAELENLGVRYFTEAIPVWKDGELWHKHIHISAIDKYYVKDKEHNWFSVNRDECGLCNP